MQDVTVSVPILTVTPGSFDPDTILKSRMGYAANDCIKALETALSDPSTTSMGRALHFSADMVCSGGYNMWRKFCYEYAFDHVGLASLRVFHYLNGRFRELDAAWDKMPSEDFYASEEIQRKIGEVVLVLQASPRAGKLKWPAVGKETHKNPTWLSSTRRAPDSSAVQKVWSRGTDMNELFVAGNELLYACGEGALERALFWLKWVIEEDTMVKKEMGGGLTTNDHGINGGKKAKASPVHFLFKCCIEKYKEMAAKGLLRMNDEVQALATLYINAPPALLTGRRKLDIVIILLQVLCEVPKWKVPAAGPVVKDPVVLGRAVAQVPAFFKEVLSRPAPSKIIKKQPVKKVKKGLELGSTDSKLALLDKVANSFYGM